MLFRKKLQNIFLIKVVLGLLFVVSFCFAQGTWTHKEPIPTARIFAGSCELDGKIYVIGGAQDNNSSLSTLEVYDPVANTWDTTKANMPTTRAELCVAAVSGKIFAIGGAPAHNSGPALGVVEEYDPSTDSWLSKTSIPTPRKGAACGVINNKIYVAGGATSNWVMSNKLEIYDAVADTWTVGENLNTPIYASQGAVLNDTFFVIGGLIGSPWIGQKTVQKYDPFTDNWTNGTNLINERCAHTSNVVNDTIYVIGGDRQHPIVENVERYNPFNQSWKVIDPTPHGMVCHTSCVYDNEIFIFSGSTTYLFPQPTLTDSVYSYVPPTDTTSIELLENLTPTNFRLTQNYPNPFNPSTTIEFSIPKVEFVTLKIYNLLGQKVTTLVSDKLTPGKYKYTWDASHLASGVYIYKIQTDNGFTKTKKLLLIK